MLVIDAANVIGSRPDGWWRDRPGAADRLVTRVEQAVSTGTLTGPVTVVLEGQARRGRPAGDHAEVVVVHAPASGDDTIVALVTAGGGVTVVSADRGLAVRVAGAGGTVVGPRWLLDRLGG